MWTAAGDLEILMERLAQAGVEMMVRVDVERFELARSHWTLLLSGPRLQPDDVIRVDARSLGDCVGKGLGRLRGLGGDWEWLDDWV